MFHSKDIYDPEWLELVFENRNKNYGAYELRKHYAGTVLRAMAITVTSLSAIFIGCILIFNNKIKALTVSDKVDVINHSIKILPETVNKKPSTAPHQSTQQQAENGKRTTIGYRKTEPMVIEKPDVETGNTPVNATLPDRLPASNDAVDNDEADVKPMPTGGAQKWLSYLEANLRYPPEARQQRISGKVWLSFIVERDGRLSNIVIDRPAGHGFDEEAVRVLKQSPVWAPGLQNGQTIRVKYSMPINFYIQHLQ